MAAVAVGADCLVQQHVTQRAGDVAEVAAFVLPRAQHGPFAVAAAIDYHFVQLAPRYADSRHALDVEHALVLLIVSLLRFAFESNVVELMVVGVLCMRQETLLIEIVAFAVAFVYYYLCCYLFHHLIYLRQIYLVVVDYEYACTKVAREHIVVVALQIAGVVAA